MARNPHFLPEPQVLTGILGGVEETETGKTLAVVDYKGFRVVIPLKEMLVKLEKNLKGAEYSDMIRRQNKLLSNMLGCEIDFIVKGVDSKTRTVVASRKEAMLKKRQTFYMNTDASGAYRIFEGAHRTSPCYCRSGKGHPNRSLWCGVLYCCP